ncbi:ras-related protein rab-5a [Stylonychia lemnae]|uniref:Ras-related protein rab-5a n=1 Tax=Stylonychia lemnae TaxID=5949 RepID=A0A078A728_STYLE|nr:ras-related protein rab-5a [Stylonychia lemnae]|eukprot:CDW77686.1 ras-related protein rab-5a [Stylonychia lemnae]
MTAMFKVVLLGDTSVGKTSILQRYAKGNFKKEQDATIGAHFMSKMVDLPQSNTQIKLQIWDTAGQEKYRSVTPIYFRDAAAAICVFDITNKQSLDNAERWIDDLRNSAPSHIIVALAGNKCDLFSNEEVSIQQGKEFALKHQVEIFQQTSAKEDTGINELFLKIASKIDKNKDVILANSKQNMNIGGGDGPEKKKKKCC